MNIDTKIIKNIFETPARTLESTIEETQIIEKEIGKQKPVKEAKNYWNTLGPGLITGAVDDDPSGIGTYSQVGSKFGFAYLWLSAFTFPLMSVIQEMCARIGIVTGRGLAANIKHHFPKWVILVASLLLFGANTFNLGADLGAMAKSTQLILPQANFYLLLVIFTLVSLGLPIFMSYKKYARILKWLSLIIITYVVTGFIIGGDIKTILINTFIPHIDFSKESLILICAFLGTSITPYLFFWQTSQEVEEEVAVGKTSIKLRTTDVSPKEIKRMRVDVVSGMFFCQLVAFFIILTCAGTLWKNGITNIATAEDAALALRPLAGQYASLLFTVGIVGTGLLAIPVLAGSAAYCLSETLGVPYGLDRKLKGAYAFYGVMIISVALGFTINLFNFDAIKLLIYSAFANGLIAPIILALIILLTSSSKIMGKYKNHPLITTVGWLTTLVMTVSAIAAVISLL